MDSSEYSRLKSISLYERKLRKKGYKLIAGIDESGRGPLAGPVVVVCCLLKDYFSISGVDDCKKVDKESRVRIYEELTKSENVIYSFSVVPHEVIDRVNILQATFVAMREAVEKLSIKPDYLLVDGKFIPSFSIPSLAIIKGDSLSVSIAAASIIAKVIRDGIMDKYHEIWPHYGFNTNRGYATEEHREAIRNHGPCEIHRRSFTLLPKDEQLTFDFSNN